MSSDEAKHRDADTTANCHLLLRYYNLRLRLINISDCDKESRARWEAERAAALGKRYHPSSNGEMTTEIDDLCIKISDSKGPAPLQELFAYFDTRQTERAR